MKPLRSRKEFKNVLKVQTSQEQMERWNRTRYEAQQMDRMYRKALLMDYYKMSEESVDALLRIVPENRREICKEMSVNAYIVRTLFDYTKYPDCYKLYQLLDAYVDWPEISVLDFGCLVSDYGYFFGMLGARVSICDFKDPVDFASFRLQRAGIPHSVTYAPAEYQEITMNQDLVVFSEILEHLEDPYTLLEACVHNKVRFIYTTHYPYGDEVYFGLTGHTKQAKEQAIPSLDLLQKHYCEVSSFKFRRIWILKELFED